MSVEPDHAAGPLDPAQPPGPGPVAPRAKELRPRRAGDADAVGLVATYDPGDAPVTLARAQRVVARAHGFAGWSLTGRAHGGAGELDPRRWTPPRGLETPSKGSCGRPACATPNRPPPAGPPRCSAADPSLATRTRRDPGGLRRGGPPGGPGAADPGRRTGRTDRTAGRRCCTCAIRAWTSATRRARSGYCWMPAPTRQRFPVEGPALPVHRADRGARRWRAGRAAAPGRWRWRRGCSTPAPTPTTTRPSTTGSSVPTTAPRTAAAARRGPCRTPRPGGTGSASAYPSPEQMVGEHLRTAAQHGFDERVRILLEHGVDPNTRGYHPILGDQSAYEVAVRSGHDRGGDDGGRRGWAQRPPGRRRPAARGRLRRRECDGGRAARAVRGPPAAGPGRCGSPANSTTATRGPTARTGLRPGCGRARPGHRTARGGVAGRGRNVRVVAGARRRPDNPGPGFGGTAAGWAAHAGHRSWRPGSAAIDRGHESIDFDRCQPIVDPC